MPVSIGRLRRWFVAALAIVCVMVGGSYLYLRHRVTNALKQVREKIPIEVQQSAQQFTISKSEQGRTIFKLQASKAVQFKQGGRTELHDVTITLYGRDSSRFDQVYGEAFDYDPPSGNVTGKGEVSIDLARHLVTVRGEPVNLTRSEFQVLRLLAERPGQVFSRLEIMEELWQSEFSGDVRACDVHISNLRQKIERDPQDPELVVTVRGIGYKLVEPE